MCRDGHAAPLPHTQTGEEWMSAYCPIVLLRVLVGGHARDLRLLGFTPVAMSENGFAPWPAWLVAGSRGELSGEKKKKASPSRSGCPPRPRQRSRPPDPIDAPGCVIQPAQRCPLPQGGALGTGLSVGAFEAVPFPITPWAHGAARAALGRPSLFPAEFKVLRPRPACR